MQNKAYPLSRQEISGQQVIFTGKKKEGTVLFPLSCSAIPIFVSDLHDLFFL
jgi:hypothetical protein